MSSIQEIKSFFQDEHEPPASPMQNTVRKLQDENNKRESVNYTNQTIQENKELKNVNDLLKYNMELLTKQMNELYADHEVNENKMILQVIIFFIVLIYIFQIRNLKNSNTDLEQEKEKLLIQIKHLENELKNTTNFFEQENFKSIFISYMDYLNSK